MDRIDRAVLKWGLLILAANAIAFEIHRWLER